MPLPILLASLLLAPQRDKGFVSDPRYPWVVAGLSLAYREGDILGYPETLYGFRRPGSRYEYAVGVHAAESRRLERLESFLAKPSSDVEQAALVRGEVLLSFYRRADAEFSKELTDIGVTPDDRQTRLAALTRQIEANAPARTRLFRDVPADHWAAKAVSDLRALGLLDGYPDGSYRGK